MRIATAIVNWNNPDIPDVIPWIPYGEAMDHFVEAGYDATEWGPSMPTDPDVLGHDLRSRGLDMVGAFVGLGFRDADKRESEIERALGIARFLVVNGGTRLIAAEAGDDRRRGEAGHVDESRGLTDEQWRNLAHGLEELGRRLEPFGMELVFHNHVGTYVETPAETARLLEETDPALVGWCLDIGHLAFGGGDCGRHAGDVRGPREARARQGRRRRRPGAGEGGGLELRPGPRRLHLPAAGGGDRAHPRGRGRAPRGGLRRLVRHRAGHQPRPDRHGLAQSRVPRGAARRSDGGDRGPRNDRG